jgi:hypothetical protein
MKLNKFVSELCGKLPELKVQDIVFNSALNPALDGHGDGAEILKHFLLRKPVKHVLEIGTYNGLATGFIAQFADKVTTIDIEDHPEKHKIWEAIGVESRITSIIVENEEEKKAIIGALNFDVAFVDGNHFGKYPKSDFEMVKHCGRVILHDYHKDFPDVVKFVDSLDSNTREIKGLFAYWEDSLSPEVIFPEFNFNLDYVRSHFKGKGLDMGCGCCPLLEPNCIHVDHSPQPGAVELVGDEFMQGDAVTFDPRYKVDYVFSSHMVEDLPTEDAIIDCLNMWGKLLKKSGKIILLLPDMLGGRYSTVEEGGNPSHRVNVGVKFIEGILPKLKGLSLVQIDTIPHDKSCTLDVVFRKVAK